MTSGHEDNTMVPLDMRGDGIQSRHIPIILKYLAEEDQKTRNQGSVKVTSIWGYEEPENGIELLRSFEVAKSFYEYSHEIQLFITTHSPAFYQQEDHDDVKVLYVKKNESNETVISDTISNREIGCSMGLMPLVAPFIAEKEQQLNDLIKSASNELLVDVPTIFVEGITDKKYIELAIELFSSQLKSMLDNDQLRVFTVVGEAGCSQIYNWVHAWIYKNNKSKTLSLFDKDSAGIEAHDKLVNSIVYKQAKNNKAEFLPPTDAIITLYSKKIYLPYEIEHLLSTQCWGKIIEA